MKKHLTNKSNIRRTRRHGFLKRMATRGGRRTISRRREKGRWQLIPA
jgi:large subunit ribosomal protein L34